MFGVRRGLHLGGSVQYTFGSRWFFVGAGGRFFQKTGERVFVADARRARVPLGFPLKVDHHLVYVLAGWRLRLAAASRPASCPTRPRA